MQSISTNFRFKPDFHRRIKAAASARGMSLTAWVVAACLDRLRRRIGIDDDPAD
jgi:predicted HicB family RNase H-like nuclease